MNKYDKIASMFFSIAMVIFYIIAGIGFIKQDTTMGITALCLGSTNLCLLSVFINKKDNKDKKNK